MRTTRRRPTTESLPSRGSRQCVGGYNLFLWPSGLGRCDAVELLFRISSINMRNGTNNDLLLLYITLQSPCMTGVV